MSELTDVFQNVAAVLGSPTVAVGVEKAVRDLTEIDGSEFRNAVLETVVDIALLPVSGAVKGAKAAAKGVQAASEIVATTDVLRR